MGDRLTERAEALGLPWFSRTMRIGTGLLALLMFGSLLLDLPSGGSRTVVGFLVTGALMSVAGAVVVTTYLKLASLLVRVPLSLYLYP